MPYDTLGDYTRVDNSFSNPVFGTVISPTDADTFFDDVEAALNAYKGTSTSSVAIGTGSKSFTTQEEKLFTVGYSVLITSDANPTTNFMFGRVTSYSGTALEVNVTVIGGSGTHADWTIRLAAERGGSGPMHGIRQAYDSTTTDADPGAGEFRLNNATPASATAAYLDNVDADGATVSTVIDKWDDSTSTTRGFLRIEKEGDPSIWAEFSVTGSVTDGTGYRKLTLTGGSGSGAFTAADVFRISFIRTGDSGSIAGGILQTVYIRANAMISRSTNGAAYSLLEMATNKNMVSTMNFDATTQEFAQFAFTFPKGWNEGTITFIPYWSHPSTTTNFGVVWALQAVARSDDDALDVAFGTEQTSTDTGGTTNDLYAGPTSSAITIAGTPAAGDEVQFQIKRNVSDGSDTLAVDARLHGVKILYTLDTLDDT